LRVVDYHELAQQRPEVERFVFSPFCHGTGLGQAVLLELLSQGAKVFVGTSEDSVKFYGFAVLHRGQLGWLYVKDVQLPQDDGTVWRLRGRGVSKALLAAAGFAKPGPVPLLFDVPAARSAAARFTRSGWRVIFPSTPQESAA
jgi:hypothetical protein